MIIKYPLEAINGDLVRTNSAEEEITSLILLFLSTVRGELAWDVRLGIPFYLFESRQNIQQDLALFEIALKSAMPSVSFQVFGNLDESGLVYIEIRWVSEENMNGVLNFEFEI